MVVADFTTIHNGNEAMVVLRDADDVMRYEALVQIGGTVERRAVSTLSGYLPYDASGAEVIGQIQAAPPIISPAPLNQITVGARSLVIFP